MLFNVWTQDQVKRMPRQLYLAVRESSEVEDDQNESTVFLFLFLFFFTDQSEMVAQHGSSVTIQRGLIRMMICLSQRTVS